MVEVIVGTDSGKISGFEKEGVVQFRGIPYAAPPVGARRFRAPQPAEPWDGVRPCTAYGPTAPQGMGGMEQLAGASSLPASEDCLYLNVCTPAADDGQRPVMVWIHGGGFTTGSGSVPWYNGARLAQAGDTVVVTVNYRLGALGFSHLDDQLGADYAGSGNAGILDQVAALRWVHDNIAAFGGDPANVTIFGESAGGMSVGTLLATPSARGLFAKAIAQSGAAHNARTAESAAEVTAKLLAALGLPADGAAGLLDVPLDALMAAQGNVLAEYQLTRLTAGGRGLTMPFQPVVDGSSIPVRPVDAVAAGSAAGVAVMAGTTREEWKLFELLTPSDKQVDDAGLAKRAEALFGAERAQDAIDAYRAELPGAPARDVWTAVMTDLVFRIPAVRLLEAQQGHGATYSYVFSWQSSAFDGRLGACHALEIPFVFDNLHRRGVEFFLGTVGDDERALAGAMSAAWLAFARDGRPESSGLPGWAAYDTDTRSTMVLDTLPALVDDPAGDSRELWSGIL